MPGLSFPVYPERWNSLLRCKDSKSVLKRIFDQILEISLCKGIKTKTDIVPPSELGYGLPNENLNADATRGVEGMISYRGDAGNFRYNVAAHATLSRSKTLYTYKPHTYKPRYSNSWDEYRNTREDRWNNITWVYDYIGQFQSMEEIENYPINNDGRGNSTMLPGDLKYRDVNGDMIISGFDQVPLGYATGINPYLSFGLNANMSWKAFGLTMDFSGGQCKIITLEKSP